ncbi:hydrophobin 2 [Mycena amicta]|nr:hydrophobin 2 [Mycena amicta]
MFNMLVALFALFTFAAAAPAPNGLLSRDSSSGSQQCCASVIPSTDPTAAFIASLVGISLAGLNVPVGLSCSPITVIGNNCGGTAVTCDAPEVQNGGLININCIPITA